MEQLESPFACKTLRNEADDVAAKKARISALKKPALPRMRLEMMRKLDQNAGYIKMTDKEEKPSIMRSKKLRDNNTSCNVAFDEEECESKESTNK
ncbi:hypothetical protein KIN20_029421 [Parelaphostrongylus tenuis]|uniref:Uncharacterized protein n=1 Tax=Parelaphostrongylus tenuis TaxID=148309 RepID=A0AAD5WFH1_PARTN|nr:hypothetical protein KIN20_029421 [Parelaphostrongylus tenuis]